MGESARPVIAEALKSLHVETRPGISVATIDAGGVTLTIGERIDARTVIWCAGMKANPLTACFPLARDRFGRPETPDLTIDGLIAEFAAGDVASLRSTALIPVSCPASMVGRWGGSPGTMWFATC